MQAKTLNCLPTEEEKPVSLQRPMEIAPSIGWKAHPTEPPLTPSPLFGVQCRSDDAMAAAKRDVPTWWPFVSRKRLLSPEHPGAQDVLHHALVAGVQPLVLIGERAVG